jgi:hypothetical protein
MMVLGRFGRNWRSLRFYKGKTRLCLHRRPLLKNTLSDSVIRGLKKETLSLCTVHGVAKITSAKVVGQSMNTKGE